MKFKPFIEKYAIPLVALLGGLLFLVMGTVKLVQVNTFPQTTAVITRMEIVPGAADEPDSYEVYVRYAVEGSSYESKLDNYKSSYRVGKTIHVRYDPKNPRDVTGMSSLGACFVIAFGVLLLVVGVLTGKRTLQTAAAERRKRLEE